MCQRPFAVNVIFLEPHWGSKRLAISQKVQTQIMWKAVPIEIVLRNSNGVYYFVYHLMENSGTQPGTRLLKSEKYF